MAWAKIEYENSNSYGKGAFLSLKPAESAVGVFVGEPLMYQNHYKLGRCSEDRDCKHCIAGSKPSFRFEANFITIENGMWVCKVFASGVNAYNSICVLGEDYDLGTYKFRLTRMNDDKKPWAITPIPRGDLSADESHLISKVEWKVKVDAKPAPAKKLDGMDDDIGF